MFHRELRDILWKISRVGFSISAFLRLNRMDSLSISADQSWHWARSAAIAGASVPLAATSRARPHAGEALGGGWSTVAR